jgi:hypothetical protein
MLGAGTVTSLAKALIPSAIEGVRGLWPDAAHFET